MGNTPWAPTQGAAPAAPASAVDEAAKPNGAASAAGVPSDAPQDVIDENDPRLVSESLEANLEADAYAQPAPPPDGRYRAKLKLEGVKVEGSTEKKDFSTGKNKKSGIPYYKTGVSCSIIDPSGRFDGIVCYPAFGGGANTDMRRDGSTQVTTILTRIKKPDGTPWAVKGVKMSQLEWITLFTKALAGEPEIGIETSWEASCQKCAEELKPKGEYAVRTTGMHNFPQETDPAKRKLGQAFHPELKCSRNPAHGTSKARPIVTGFLHLHELK